MNNPYYKLGPIKEEIIHLSPNIWMYHDVASPLERRGIIETAGPFVSQTVVKSLNQIGHEIVESFCCYASKNQLLLEGVSKKILPSFFAY